MSRSSRWCPVAGLVCTRMCDPEPFRVVLRIFFLDESQVSSHAPTVMRAVRDWPEAKRRFVSS
ncbi:hypothetical protein RKE29_01900 [Streptomyces sp. B1866]|uniref:hypothetical protein n=1 Tax=Streptomyces sp. B1866 TaxID=3075431 RepID=UPI002891AF1E|nr:hypothetical protein [Streptomyces sp. B1866]MDT3395413.1 hypothetical protein [Streptomyces sp. B1866]